LLLAQAKAKNSTLHNLFFLTVNEHKDGNISVSIALRFIASLTPSSFSVYDIST